MISPQRRKDAEEKQANRCIPIAVSITRKGLFASQPPNCFNLVDNNHPRNLFRLRDILFSASLRLCGEKFYV